jgi:hypothetical protein
MAVGGGESTVNRDITRVADLDWISLTEGIQPCSAPSRYWFHLS